MSLKCECAKNINIVEIDNEWIIMDTENFTVTKVNAIGAYILEEVRGQRELEDIICNIADNYDVDLNTARSDVLIFLEELKGIGLIKNGRA
ncbi:Coenzyme PQQ synthesis protein D (PqqD) [Bacillus sp. 491mf]|uniref:PqqD family protein n=1 Tax=Bacillus TaxID=1386 RepID=UPI000550BF4D|nr:MULTISPECIES: PqqD family protein [unclassified Bacillus (in: firmicutes)]SFC75137.1 Coenzyme PQQ synthesis protein D (PqqD) [Bacillus sp. 491mf]